MNMEQGKKKMSDFQNEERKARSLPGMPMLIVLLLLLLAAIIFGIRACIDVNVAMLVICGVYVCLIFPVLCAGLKILKPNEAYVFTLFGKYNGSLKGSGFYFVNPFVSATNPAAASLSEVIAETANKSSGKSSKEITAKTNKKISLKTMTLNN